MFRTGSEASLILTVLLFYIICCVWEHSSTVFSYGLSVRTIKLSDNSPAAISCYAFVGHTQALILMEALSV